MTLQHWRRFVCGLSSFDASEPWIPADAWDRLAEPGLRLDPQAPTWLGLDVGVRHDSTAVVAVQRRADGTVACRGWVLEPTEDAPVTLERIERLVRELARELRPRWIAYDPWSFRRSAELLRAEGLPMLEFPQSPERMSVASRALYELISSGRLRHDGDRTLRAHVLAAVAKQTERAWRLVKDRTSRQPIDAVIALAMAVAAMESPAPEAPRAPRLIPLHEDSCGCSICRGWRAAQCDREDDGLRVG